MNSSTTQTGQVAVEWEYTAIAALGLFVLSEIMPFIKKNKRSRINTFYDLFIERFKMYGG